MFISYTSYDEVIVCTPDTEVETLRRFFKEGDRDITEYGREETNDVAITVTAQLGLN